MRSSRQEPPIEQVETWLSDARLLQSMARDGITQGTARHIVDSIHGGALPTDKGIERLYGRIGHFQKPEEQ